MIEIPLTRNEILKDKLKNLLLEMNENDNIEIKFCDKEFDIQIEQFPFPFNEVHKLTIKKKTQRITIVSVIDMTNN